MAFAETQELAVRLTLKDQLSPALGKAQTALGRFDRATSNTQKALANTTTNLSRLATVGLAATAAGLFGVVKAAGDFESAFAGVRKTVDATELAAAGLTFDQLAQSFRDMAKTMPITASELARIGEAAGALGIAAQDIDDFTKTVATLSVTTTLTTDEAAESLGKLGTILGLTGNDFEEFADALVALGNAGASTEPEIIEVTKRFAAAGKQAGLTADQILAYASAITSMGVEPEAAGSSLSRIFNNLAKETAVASEKATAFAKTIGLSFKDFRKLVADDPNKAILSLLERLNQLQAAGKRLEAAKILSDIGVNNVRDINAILLLSQGLDKLGASFDTVANKAGASSKEAAVRFQTFNSQLQIAKNVLTDVGITIGSKLLPKLVPLLKRLGDFVNQNQDKIEQFGTDLATGFEQFADAVGKTDFTPLVNGLRLTFEIAKKAIEVFKALPAPIQQLLIAGAAINKVTGGLVTGLSKDIIGGLIGRFRGQTPAAPMFVSVVGGLPGGGVPTATGKAGAAARVASAIGKVFIIGAAVGVFAELKGVLEEQGRQNRAAAQALAEQTQEFADKASIEDMKTSLAGIEAYSAKLTRELTPEAIAYQLNIDGAADSVNAQIQTLKTAISLEENKTRVQAGIQSQVASEHADANLRATDRVRASLDQNTGVTRTTADYVADQIKRNEQATRTVAGQVTQATRTIATGTTQTVASLTRIVAAQNTTRAAVAAVTAATQRVGAAVAGTTAAVNRKAFSATINLRTNNTVYFDGRKFTNTVTGVQVAVKPGQQGIVQEYG